MTLLHVYANQIQLRYNKIKKKKKKNPPALPYLKISCYSNYFFFGALCQVDMEILTIILMYDIEYIESLTYVHVQ